MNKELQTSHWYQRLIGFIIDYAFAMLLAEPFAYNYDYKFNLTFYEALQAFTPATYLVYLLISETIFNKSLGKLITCTVVRNKINLSATGFGRILLRTICRLIPLEFFSFIANKPYGIHDRISGTIIVNSKYSYALFYKRFKLTNKGFLRLNWVLSIAAGIPTFGIGFLLYWIIARIFLWIYDGFKSENSVTINPIVSPISNSES